MADTAPKLPIRGMDISVVVYEGNTPLDQTDLVKKCSISEQNVQHRDSYLGQDYDRTDEQPKGWNVDLDLDVATSVIYAALLRQKALRQARKPFKQISIAMVINERDGQAHSVLVTNLTTKMSLEMGGKDERYTMRISCEGEQCIVSPL